VRRVSTGGQLLLLALLSLLPTASLPAEAAGDKVYAFEDQQIRIEAAVASVSARGDFDLQISMNPRSGWKILADNSSGSKPLRLKFSPGKCLKLKGKSSMPAPDLAGTDESGAYSEYYTKETVFRQEFGRLPCGQKKGAEGVASISYLLCQDKRCVGPFSREMRFKAP